MKKILNFEVVSNIAVARDCVELVLKAPEGGEVPTILPGQFVNVEVPDKSVFLRRPVSVHDYRQGLLRLLIQVVGKGTGSLAGIAAGEKLNLVLPLGNSFPLNDPHGKTFLLIGGGAGVAPLYFYARYLLENGANVKFVTGARSHDRLIAADRFAELAETEIFTDDGSAGTKGLVSESVVLNEGECDVIACCGPLPMMKAVADIALKRQIDCYVSLENRMACGIGACLCCVEETVHGNECVCTKGPVFNIKELKW